MHSAMAHSTQSPVLPNGENWMAPANATDLETSTLLAPYADEEGGAVEGWTPQSLGASFIWIETGMIASSSSLPLN